MPELPEVETTLWGIYPHIQAQRIKDVIIRHPRLRWPIPHQIGSKLIGNKIEQIQRRAKYLLLTVGKGTLIIHLGMSGRLRILTKSIPPQKHDHIDIVFSNHKILRFTDPRRFGAFLWTEQAIHLHSLLKNLGPEPLEKSFTSRYLLQQAQDRKIPIKSFIMDNKIVVGVGNIYAAEALFLAKINPLKPVKNITLIEFTRLVTAIKKILRLAIKQGGTTVKDFVNSEGKPGYFSQYLKVYGRAGMPCVSCQTILQSVRIGQRSTVYCGRCQCG